MYIGIYVYLYMMIGVYIHTEVQAEGLKASDAAATELLGFAKNRLNKLLDRYQQGPNSYPIGSNTYTVAVR